MPSPEGEMQAVQDGQHYSPTPPEDDPDEVTLNDVDSDGEPEDTQPRDLFEWPRAPSSPCPEDLSLPPSPDELSQESPKPSTPQATTPVANQMEGEDNAVATPRENKKDIVLIEDTPDKGVVEEPQCSEVELLDRLRALRGELSSFRQRRTAERLV